MAIFEIKFRDSAEVKRIQADVNQDETNSGFLMFLREAKEDGYQLVYMVRLSEILSVERVPELKGELVDIPEKVLEDLGRKLQGGRFV